MVQMGLAFRRRVKILSYGGGLDSFAMLLDAIARKELPDLVIFADVTDPDRKDPGEWPGTYRHIEEVVIPICHAAGLEFKWLRTDEIPIRGVRSLYAYFRSKNIMPSRTSRLCTSAAKVERIWQYVQDRWPGHPVEMWIGFEAGEDVRVDRDPHAGGKQTDMKMTRFPLVESDICRCRAESMVFKLGLPVPRKSACMMCPYGSRGDFKTLQRELPEVFRQLEELEADCKKTKAGKTIRFAFITGEESDPVLSSWIKSDYKPRVIPCQICGAPVRATKATGCGYLHDGQRQEIET